MCWESIEHSREHMTFWSRVSWESIEGLVAGLQGNLCLFPSYKNLYFSTMESQPIVTLLSFAPLIFIK